MTTTKEKLGNTQKKTSKTQRRRVIADPHEVGELPGADALRAEVIGSVRSIARQALASDPPDWAVALRASELLGRHLGLFAGASESRASGEPKRLVQVHIVPRMDEMEYEGADPDDEGDLYDAPNGDHPSVAFYPDDALLPHIEGEYRDVPPSGNVGNGIPHLRVVKRDGEDS